MNFFDYLYQKYPEFKYKYTRKTTKRNSFKV